MRLLIEIAAAALLVICIATSSAAFAAGKGRNADGLSCGFSLPQNATPATTLRRDQAPMRRQVLCECVRGQVGVGGELRRVTC
ncbi:hypothetical protein ABIF41_006837 [Bradyrhizobium japonicum]|uniref:hypothetical protein n=1 Tax=Bradyrhizobium diazoefficiens TaxID=1355477 RepID=UPI00348B9207